MADNPFGGIAAGIQTGMKLQAAEAKRKAAEAKAGQSAANADALNAYRQGQLKLSERRAVAQERQLDLTMAQRLTQVLSDTQMHPEARAFLLDEIVSASGHDLNSERYKGLKKVLLKMPTDQANALADAIAQGLPNTEPGAIRGIVDGLLKGQVSPGDIPKIIQGFGQQQSRSDILGEGGDQPPSQPEGQFGGLAGTMFEPGTEPTGGMTQAPAAPEQPATDDAVGVADRLLDPTELRKKAQRLGAAGDLEGMRAVLQMARDVADKPKEYESTEEKKIAERDYTLLKELDTDVQTSHKAEASLKAFETALDGGRFTPGSFSSLRQSMSQIAEFVGLNPEDPTFKMLLGTGDPATAETLHAASNRLALDLAENLSKMTNMSLAFVSDSVPNLMRTPAGNKIIIQMIRAGNARTQQASDLAEDFLSKYKTLRPKDKRSYFQEVQRLYEKPLFDKDFETMVKEEARKGAGVNISGGVQSLEEQIPEGGEQPKTITTGDGKRTFPVVSSEGGNDLVTTDHGDIPLVRSTEQYDAMPPDKPFVWWPDGRILMKTK